MTMINHVLAQVTQGHLVFDLWPGTKHPIRSGGFYNGTLDVELIKGWWDESLEINGINANYGIRTGKESNLTVIDVDGPLGVASMKKLRAEGFDIPDGTRTIKTPHGYHIYLRYTESLPTCTGFRPGIDIRNDLASVVGPGSYVICDKRDKGCDGDHSYEYIIIKNDPKKELIKIPPVLPKTSTPGEFVSGGRNDELIQIAGYLKHSGLPLEAIRAAIYSYNESEFDPPLTEEEIESTILSSAAKWEREPTSNLTSHYTDQVWEVRSLVRKNAQDLKDDSSDFELPTLPFLDQTGLAVDGWSHILAAPPKTGKTELMVQLCYGWHDKRITYYTEEPESIWRARLSKYPNLPNTGSIEGGEVTRTGWEHMELVFALGASLEDIRKDIAETPGDLVVIDTTRNLLQLKDENDNTTQARQLIPFVSAAREGGKTLWFLHHIRKGGGEHGEGISGGHAFLGVVDAALEITRDKVKNRRKIEGWARIIAIPELVYEMDDRGMMVALGDPAKVALEAVKEGLRNVLPNEWTKIKDALELLDEPRPGLEQVRKALKELGASGYVQRNPSFAEGDKPGSTYLWRITQITQRDESPQPVRSTTAEPGHLVTFAKKEFGAYDLPDEDVIDEDVIEFDEPEKEEWEA